MNFFYNLVIMPLIMLMDLIFSIGYKIFDNPGIAIIGVSLGVNIFSLPLYRRADAIQSEERDLQKIMAPAVKHIRKTFKGDEQFMILQAYYNEMDYSPLMVFRGSLPLLLQIPFFTAAYRYLSGLSILKGASFLILSDMGSPDGLLVLGGLTLNLLPILMTLINFISGMIYTRGFPLKDKAQLYILALVFMVILYNSPSGLVFYWTLNNLFSLFKNIFLKLLPSPGKIIAWIVGILSIVMAFFLTATGHLGDISGMAGFNNLLLVLIIVFCLNIPLITLLTKGKRLLPEKFSGFAENYDPVLRSRALAFLGSLFLTLFVGVIVPVSVIGGNPLDFIDNDDFVNPLKYIQFDLNVAAGFFLFWGVVVFFSLMGETTRKTYNLVMGILSGIAVLDFMVFHKDFGNISTNLRFDDHVAFSRKETLVNLVAVIIVAVLLYIFISLKPRLCRTLFIILVTTGVLFSAIKIYGINSTIKSSRYSIEAEAMTEDDSPIFHLSRKGKNVVILFLDRAISGYFPYIMNEKPSLAEKFEGFTYYPNTISFGTHTIYGAPALYGGYEYTPYEINKRTDETLKSKHDESLRVLPAIFSEAGYDVTVADPPDAGLADPPDLSIYDGMKNVRAYNTVTGQYFHLLSEEEKACWREDLMYRKYYLYSYFKISPYLLQPHIYDEGNYLSMEKTEITKRFLNRYAVIKNLSTLTEIDDNETGGMLFIDNTTPHEPVVLQLPDYVPEKNTDNTGYDDTSRFTLNGRTVHAENDPTPYHYHVNAASYSEVGKWFDYLKEEGVYDNTRIIIVADHGRNLAQFDDMIMDDGKLDVMYVNPVLLVKDFGERGEWKTDDSFMTNADTPSIALEGIVEDPVNPYTGKRIDSSEKYAHDQYITMSEIVGNGEHGESGYDTSDADWYSVHDDIFVDGNWTDMGSYEELKNAVEGH